jgi:hypothetical protein
MHYASCLIPVGFTMIPKATVFYCGIFIILHDNVDHLVFNIDDLFG